MKSPGANERFSSGTVEVVSNSAILQEVVEALLFLHEY
jgi:hypothetical protein